MKAISSINLLFISLLFQTVSSILYKKCIQIGGLQKNVFLTQHIDVKILLRGACNINRFAGVSSRIFWSGSKEL